MSKYCAEIVPREKQSTDFSQISQATFFQILNNYLGSLKTKNSPPLSGLRIFLRV